MAGPAYIVSLRNALEDRPAPEYRAPPRTGGTQISLRLDEFVYNHVESVVAQSGWNRAEVLHALIQRGLFDLYEFCSPDTVDRIVANVVAKLAPPHPPLPGRNDDMMNKTIEYLLEISEYEGRTDAQIDSAINMFIYKSEMHPDGPRAQRKELADRFASQAPKSEACQHIYRRILH